MFKKLASEFGMSAKKAKEFFERALELATETAAESGRVFVGRSNYFKRIDRSSRSYRNPRTGETGRTNPSSIVRLIKKIA